MKVFLEMFAALDYQGLKFCDVTNFNRCLAREHKQVLIGNQSVYKCVFEPFSITEAPRLAS